MIRIIRSIDGILEIHETWRKLQFHPNSDIDQFLTIIKYRSDIIRPHVIVFERDGEIKGLLAGRLERRRISFNVGYKTIHSPIVNVISIIYGGYLGEDSIEIATYYIKGLKISLSNGEADVIYFNNILTNSNVLVAINNTNEYLLNNNSNIDMHWVMDIPKDMSLFYNKFKPHRRHELKRYRNVLEKKFISDTYWVCYKDLNNLDKICNDLEEIQKITYHRGLNVGFILNEENINRLSVWLKKGSLRVYILYISNRPSAFWVGTGYGTTFYLNFTGYNPEFKKYEIGTILFQYMVEDLIMEKYDIIDFGFGDAYYKKRFCDRYWEESSFYMYSKTWRSFLIMAINVMTSVVNRYANKLIGKLYSTDKLKKKWREWKVMHL